MRKLTDFSIYLIIFIAIVLILFLAILAFSNDIVPREVLAMFGIMKINDEIKDLIYG